MTPVATQGVNQLTQTERWLCHEHLRALQLVARKCQVYGTVAQSPQLRSLIQRCQQRVQQHVHQLQGLVQAPAGFAPTRY